MKTPRLSLATPHVALAIVASSACPSPEPEGEGPLREEVVELEFPDIMGRRIFVSLDRFGREFDRGVAASTEGAERVVRRLYAGLVYERLHRLTLLK